MKNIALVVDMQNGFARYNQTELLTKKIADLLNKKIFDCVIATRFLNDSHSVYEKLFGWKRLRSEYDRQISPEIEKNVDFIFDKYVYDCVSPSFIQKLCQVNGGVYPDRVFVLGADTDCCILTISTSLFENNIRPIVLSSYCNSNGGEESHRAGLICLKRLIGANQIYTGEIVNKEELNHI